MLQLLRTRRQSKNRVQQEVEEGSLTLEAAISLPLMLVLCFFFLSLLLGLRQELCFSFALDQSCKDLSLLLPAVEAVLAGSKEEQLQRLFQQLLSAEEKTLLAQAAGDLASSFLLGGFLQRRLDYYLQRACQESRLRVPAHERQVLFQWHKGGHSLNVTLFYELKTAFFSYERKCEALLPLWLEQKQSKGETAAQDSEADKVWELDNFSRGRYFRTQVGANLPFNFPVICRYVGNAATAMRSIDLTAPTYATRAKLELTLEQEIARLASFTGAKLPGAAGQQVSLNASSERILILVIPCNVPPYFSSSCEQSLVQRARRSGVVLQIRRQGQSKRYAGE